MAISLPESRQFGADLSKMATLDVDLVGRSCKEKASAVTKLLLPKTDIHTVGDLR